MKNNNDLELLQAQLADSNRKLANEKAVNSRLET